MEEQAVDPSLETEENSSFVDVELEALQSIYINETAVQKDDESTTVSIDLHPATADNLDEQYVKMTLKLILEQGYPEVIPEIVIRNPRGLSDEKIMSITEDLKQLAENKKGSSMLFEIIEAAKDLLTAGNRPCEECAICLHGFHDEDVFTKTECYHYFHSHCLARYTRSIFSNKEETDSEEKSKTSELLCPVCRFAIKFDEFEESFPPPVRGGDDIFIATDDMLELQKKMKELYVQQMEKGGIIDLEAEKNKYLLEIAHVPTMVDSSEVKLENDESDINIAKGKENETVVPSTTNEKQNPERSSGKSYKEHKGNKHYQENVRYDRRDRYGNYSGSNRKYNNWNDNYKGNKYSYRNNDQYDYHKNRYEGDRRTSRYGNDQNNDRRNGDRKQNKYDNPDDDGEKLNKPNEKIDYVLDDKKDCSVDDKRVSSPDEKNYKFNNRRNFRSDNQNNYRFNDRRSDRENVNRNDYVDDRRSNRYDRPYNNRKDQFDDRRNFRSGPNGKYMYGNKMNNHYNDARNYRDGEVRRDKQFVQDRRNNRFDDGNRNRYEKRDKVNTKKEVNDKENGESSIDAEQQEGSPVCGEDSITNEESCQSTSTSEQLQEPDTFCDPKDVSEEHRTNRPKYNKQNYNYSSNYKKGHNLKYPNYQHKGRYAKYLSEDESQNTSSINENNVEAIVDEPNLSYSEEIDGDNQQWSKNNSKNNFSYDDKGQYRSKNNSFRNGEDFSKRQNKFPYSSNNYRESNTPRGFASARNNQRDNLRTPKGDSSKRYMSKNQSKDNYEHSTDNKNGSEPKTDSKPNESLPDKVEESSNQSSDISSKVPDTESHVPTSNFLPPMSTSVAPPPGFQNPARKIVYGLAAANPPPGFNRS